MSKYVVFGLGISGKSTIKFLLSQGHQVLAADDNNNALLALEKNPNLEIFNNNWNGVTALILAPGVPLNFPTPHLIVKQVREHNCKIICDIELFYQFNSTSKYIGITGTNGKSTTTALTAHIFSDAKLENASGGNIGVPCFDLPRLSKNGFYIFETSSYQLDLIDRARFHIASLLNITPDHIDRHGSMEGYIAAKKRIFMNQTQDDFALIGIDNANSHQVLEDLKNDKNFKAKLVPISTKKILEDGISVINGTIYNGISKEQFALGDLQHLKGEHNAQNIAVAFANGFLSKIDESQIVASIKSFQGLAHRMQFAGKIENINFINDSKATNAESTENALKACDNIYWILGGRKKEGGIKTLEPYFSKVKYAFLVGEASHDFANTLEGKVKYLECKTLDKAFLEAYTKAKEEKNSKEVNILLSPACASLDQWKNFEERGNYFCKLVSELKNEKHKN